MIARIGGRGIVNLCLPGDEQYLLDALIGAAVRRDGRLNGEELAAYLCAATERRYGMCMMPHCPMCGGGGGWW